MIFEACFVRRPFKTQKVKIYEVVCFYAASNLLRPLKTKRGRNEGCFARAKGIKLIKSVTFGFLV